MIPPVEIKSRALEEGIDEQTIELDYILGWLLLTIADVPALDSTLVFKGGTALRKIYQPSWRYSEDLDFTTSEGIAAAELTAAIEEWCRVAAKASGLKLGPMEHDPRPPRAGGQGNMTVKIPFVGPLARTVRPRQIKVDISDEEKVLLAAERRDVHAGFSDQKSRKSRIQVYTIEEILAEKLRSLLQRREPRDLYDAWRLLTQGEISADIERVAAIYPAKCAARSVDGTRLEQVIEGLLAGTVAQNWQIRLGHQLRDLPDIQRVVRELKRGLRRMMR